MSLRTDLANEAFEHHTSRGGAADGIKSESRAINKDIKVTRVEILTDEAAQKLGKQKGVYITITAEYISNRDAEHHSLIGRAVCEQLKELLPRPEKGRTVLVAGLGNSRMTPDALGPKTVNKLMITRHLLQMIPDQVDSRVNSVCAIAPGVLGVTGIESSDIISALCEKIKPQYIIAIDSLAAASAQRIKDTIQMSNTGIAPGAGVGNKRCGINRETLGIPVYALGIPMVVYASSVLEDFLEQNNDGRMRLSAEDYLNENIKELIVTPKEIDVIIDDCSRMLADGLNLALHDGVNMEEIRDFMY